MYDDYDGDGLVLPAGDISLTYEDNLPNGIKLLVGKTFRNKKELKEVKADYFTKKPDDLMEKEISKVPEDVQKELFEKMARDNGMYFKMFFFISM